MEADDVRSLISKASETQNVVVFKKMFNEVPDWSQFINHIDYQSTTMPPFVDVSNYKAINGILKRYNFYLQVRDAVCSPKKAKQFFPEAQAVKRIFDSAYTESSNGAIAFINFTSSEPNTDSHVDGWDNVHWQCIGSTTWEIRDNASDLDPKETIILEPGDVIVIPTGVQHAVIHTEPRAGIAFTYRVKNIEYEHGSKTE